MTDERRKKLNEAIDLSYKVREIIEQVKDAEEAEYKALPKGCHSADMEESRLLETIDTLTYALSCLEGITELQNI